MKIFFSVGEPSGDLHGANLIRELRRRDPQVQCVGYGGPRMADAGCILLEDLTQLAVMWLLRVLLNLHHFWSLYVRFPRLTSGPHSLTPSSWPRRPFTMPTSAGGPFAFSIQPSKSL